MNSVNCWRGSYANDDVSRLPPFYIGGHNNKVILRDYRPCGGGGGGRDLDAGLMPTKIPSGFPVSTRNALTRFHLNIYGYSYTKERGKNFQIN